MVGNLQLLKLQSCLDYSTISILNNSLLFKKFFAVVHCSVVSCIWLSKTPWIAAYHASLCDLRDPKALSALTSSTTVHSFTHQPNSRSAGKASACSAGDLGLIPGSVSSAGEGKGNPLQYSCQENPMDRRAWRAKSTGSPRVGHDLVQCLYVHASPSFTIPWFVPVHVHWVGGVILPSHPLSRSSPPAFNPSQYHDLFHESALCIKWSKY